MVTTTNTHLLIQEFDLLEPGTVEEAVAVLAEHGKEARPMAGGTDLIVQMKMEHLRPAYVVSLGHIEALRRIVTGDGLELGSTASIRAVSAHPTICEQYTALSEACHAFSTVQTMVMGTVGGNLCNASPAADTAPALLVLDARLRTQSLAGTRQVPVEEFFTGPGRTVLNPGELLESIHLPAPTESSGSAFIKIGRVAADISKVCAAVSVVREDDHVRTCRIALGSVAPTPRRVRRAEEALTGESVTTVSVAEVARLVCEEISPITDVRSTAEYRREVAGVVVGDALRRAWTRAGGGPAR